MSSPTVAPGPSIALSPTWVDQHFSRLLIAIAAAGLIPCLVFANVQFLEYDGWWHLFIATQDRWLALLSEWKYVAHPPLLYPFLRFVAQFGHSPAIIRSFSIVCGTIASYMFGVVAAKIYRHKTTALLAALAYTFAWSMIELNCDVRGYPLALLLVLMAFNAYLDWVADPAGSGAGRALAWFGVYGLLALASEYYVIFLVVGLVGVVIFRLVLKPAFRTATVYSLRHHWRQWAFCGLSIPGLFVALYEIQITLQPAKQFYLSTHYYDESSPFGLDGFLLSNFESEIAYFTPFHISSAVMFAIAGFLCLPAILYFLFRRSGPVCRPGAVDSVLTLGFLVGELVVLGLFVRYPFGGEFRHQSIIAPFVFLTAFLLVDGATGMLRSTALRNMLVAGVAVLSVSSFVYGWAAYPWNSEPVKAKEYALFRTMFPAPETLYGEITSMIYYFSHTHDQKWTYKDRFLVDEERITVYEVDDGKGHTTRILRNKRQAYLDLADPQTYRVLADTLRHEGLKSTILFYEGLNWDAAGAKVLEERFRTLAPQAGLDYGRYSLGTSYAFIEFKLR